MKKGFTIIEVSILFVIFLIVAFLVAPLSLDDTMQAKNISRWKNVQADFVNISHSIESIMSEEDIDFNSAFEMIVKNEIKNGILVYKISTMNGERLSKDYSFNKFKATYTNSTLAYNLFKDSEIDLAGILMYDVNGAKGPNIWGKDVFGLYIYKDGFKPFGSNLTLNEQKRACSRNGNGLACSNYYLIGGDFD